MKPRSYCLSAGLEKVTENCRACKHKLLLMPVIYCTKDEPLTAAVLTSKQMLAGDNSDACYQHRWFRENQVDYFGLCALFEKQV